MSNDNHDDHGRFASAGGSGASKAHEVKAGSGTHKGFHQADHAENKSVHQHLAEAGRRFKNERAARQEANAPRRATGASNYTKK